MRHIYWLILLAYVGLGVAFAIRTPLWQAPDEPAHYNYIRQAYEGVFLPVIQDGDWNNDTLETLKANRFAPELLNDLNAIQYEDHQPPLYYWASLPVFALTNGNVIALRLMSVLWGMITVMMAYRISQRVFDNQEAVALGVMGLVAFLPQHMMINSSINNDALANALIAVTLWLCLRYREDSHLHPILLGLALGFITLTKTTGYFMVAIVFMTLVLRSRVKGRDVLAWRGWLEASIMVAVGALPFALFWFGRNISTYGFPDFLGLRAHDAVVVGQLRTSDYIAQLGITDYVLQLAQTTFNSFWGQFGWMGVPLFGVFAPNDNLIYPVIIGLLLLALVGLLISRVRQTPLYAHDEHDTTLWRDTKLILWAMMLLALAQFAYYNTAFVQFQGRYLFGALVPFALFVGAGWVSALRPLRLQWGVLAIVGAFAVLDVYLIWRVLPNALG